MVHLNLEQAIHGLTTLQILQCRNSTAGAPFNARRCRAYNGE